MDISSFKESSAEMTMNYNSREEEKKAFLNSKAGVKGLTDAGVARLPKIFVRPPDELADEVKMCKTNIQVPVIDLSAIEEGDMREKVVTELRRASEEWGLFQVVNHGIPLKVLQGMVDGIRSFHEQDSETKKLWYSYDWKRSVRFHSNFDLYEAKSSNWRDTMTISMLVSNQIDPDEIPVSCRATSVEYIKHVRSLGNTLFELLSEALGLKRGHLNGLECDGGCSFACHYYPACPEPELTLGASKHTDPTFLTVLLQDHIGGLQVMYENQWIDVQPLSGGLVVNIGDFLQILSNDKFKSAYHRVVPKLAGPRISVAYLCAGVFTKTYGPLKELLSEESPPVYKDFLVSDYIAKFFAKALDKSALDNFKL